MDVQNLWQDLNGEKMKSFNKSRQIQVTDGGSHPLGLLCSSRTSPDQYISLMKKLLKYPSLKVDVSKMPVSKAVWKQFGQKGDQFRDIRRKQAEILLRLNCYPIGRDPGLFRSRHSSNGFLLPETGNDGKDQGACRFRTLFNSHGWRIMT